MSKNGHGDPTPAPHDCDSRRRGPGRPPEMEECERRERILDAASEVLQQCGYHAASMDKVAQHSAMSKRTLYQMFNSKQDLFHTLINTRLFNVTPDECHYRDNPAEELTELLMNLGRIILRPDRISLIRALITESQESADIRQILTSLRAGGKENVLTGWLDRYVRQHHYEVSDIYIYSNMLFGMTIGDMMLQSLACASGTAWIEQNMRPRFHKAARIFLAGFQQEHADTASPGTS
ncbi:TetR/AcrR family transcriptional regulator [Komagataeibacter oboediens]|uniref:TetR/AcrR family transcriptional regulator n=1 Tax=Komagataeibacter oboediens TaxID=65958 RepID=UPI001E5CFFCA|nr:TetR/AcrR family transcriptional regulator [Komagataeibacter oboediens]MCK9819587.1 TetR/AcrR family transcriptional regulator [Komagataeibacter oboediens]